MAGRKANRDWSTYLDKPPTDLQIRFADWLQSGVVGYDPNSAKNKMEAFLEGVRLAVALRIPFQASPENREATADRKSGERAEAPKKAAKKSAAGKPAAAVAPVKAVGRPPAKKRAATVASGEIPAPF